MSSRHISRLAVAAAGIAVVGLAAATAHAASLEPDPTFNDVGIAITTLDEATSSTHVALSGTRTYVAGDIDPGVSGSRLVAAGYAADGSIASGFGGGVLDVQPNGQAMATSGLTVRNGSLFLTAIGEAGSALYLAKVNGAAEPVESFSGDGIARVGLGALGGIEVSNATSPVIDKQGRVVVAATLSDDGQNDAVIVRIRAGGALDTDFANQGVRRIDITDFDAPTQVAIDTRGRIVVAGGMRGQGKFLGQVIAARLLGTGSLDHTFSGNGEFTGRTLDGASEDGVALHLDKQNRVVIGVNSNDGGLGFGLGAMRLTPSGAYDSSFSGNGRVRTSCACTALGGAWTSGGLVIVGEGDGAIGTDVYVARVTAGGQFDATFGTGGQEYFEFGDDERATDVVERQDGRLVLAITSADSFGAARLILP